MRTMYRMAFITLMLVGALLLSATASSADPSRKDTIKAMKEASEFMMDTVSYKGGFVWYYSKDMSEQWGEVPSRRTMVWVQDPGTVGVGRMFLQAYQKTGDTYFLDQAKKTANTLIWGQQDNGGWHYFIDFDMPGVRDWYKNVLSRCWGWEEYYHYYGNATFDDNVSTGATRFLMEMYMETLDPAYRTAMLKAFDFILESQFDNGAWPQRYPLKDDYPHDGHPDYTPFYTFNDNVIQGNIHLLLDAWKQLGDERYKDAAYRGMDFIMLSQLPEPQAGWGQQYDHDMNSAPARSYEPASVMPSQTRRCIYDLMEFYQITGNRKYLRGIPAAIDWLERSYLPKSHITEESRNGVTHATFYELGTNKPLYAHREGTSIDNGHYWVDYDPHNFPGHYGQQQRIDLDRIKADYERVEKLEPDAAQQEYQLEAALPPRIPDVDPDQAEELIDSMDDRGRWIETIRIPDYDDTVNNPRRELEGISTRSFIRNMELLSNYAANLGKDN